MRADRHCPVLTAAASGPTVPLLRLRALPMPGISVADRSGDTRVISERSASAAPRIASLWRGLWAGPGIAGPCATRPAVWPTSTDDHELLVALPGPWGSGAGADVGRDWDAGREGWVGEGLLPGGGQREVARPQAQRGIGAVAVAGRAVDLHRGLVERQRQQAHGGEFLAAGLAGVVPLAGRHVLGDGAQPGEPFAGVGDQPGVRRSWRCGS